MMRMGRVPMHTIFYCISFIAALEFTETWVKETLDSNFSKTNWIVQALVIEGCRFVSYLTDFIHLWMHSLDFKVLVLKN